MFKHPSRYDQSLRFSRMNADDLLSTVSDHPIQLEDRLWPTAEHYYQALKFDHNPVYSARIVAAGSPQEAHRLGNRWWPRPRPDFARVRRVLMTRALYSKARQHPAIAEYLLATGEQHLLETAMYDHYWGLGRDQRGKNTLGEVWMDVRTKLRQRQADDVSTTGGVSA